MGWFLSKKAKERRKRKKIFLDAVFDNNLLLVAEMLKSGKVNVNWRYYAGRSDAGIKMYLRPIDAAYSEDMKTLLRYYKARTDASIMGEYEKVKKELSAKLLKEILSKI